MKVKLHVVRESLWVGVIVVLWYSSQTTHYTLVEQAAAHAEHVRQLERLVSFTQRHSKDLVSSHCNLTALSLRVAEHREGLPPCDITAAGDHASDGLRQCEAQLEGGREELARSQATVGMITEENAALRRQGEECCASAKATAAAAASSAVLPAKTAAGAPAEWLVIGIPTVPRVNNEPFLLESLASIVGQLPSTPSHPMYCRVKIIVMNTNHGPHQRFEEARAKYAGTPEACYVEFVEEKVRLPDPFPDRRDEGSPNKPGYKVRKQTRNIVSVMRAAAGRGEYFLFSEDDMLLCPNGMLATVSLLERAQSYDPDWIAIRASFGMNGIFMKSADLQFFSDYLIEHQARRPPDHLVVEWFAGETKQSAAYKQHRKHFGFRYNLFDHLGHTSTLRREKAKEMPICFETLTRPIVFEVEAFNPRQCPKDDLWPCPPNPAVERIDWVTGGMKRALAEKAERMRH